MERPGRGVRAVGWVVVAVGIIFALAGAVTWYVVGDQLAAEKITVSEDARFLAGRSVIGPFTTSELNTRGGLRRHGQVIGPVYARLGVERADENPWTTETIEAVAHEIEQQLPHATWEENVRERDRAMIRLSSLLKLLDNPLAPRATTPTP